jgi:RNA polymerase sigma-70 factor (ECF subfamily)
MIDHEKTLLEKARQGDAEAFEKLIEAYQKKVFNIALRMLGNYDDACDIAQEVFIRAFRSIKDFREQALFSTWIYKIATNACLDELRRRKNRVFISIDEEVKLEEGDLKRQIEDDKPSPDIEVEQNEMREEINKAISELSEEHRVVIVLRDIQGFTYEEIAKITKCPEGTVKSRINRARQALKEILKPRMELLNEEFVN